MKKQNKVYSASDFQSANASVVIENCLWVIDNIDVTKEGEFSKTPLFELELRQIVTKTDDSIPEGYEDASMEMMPNRTFFVREGRPLYNRLLDIWEAVDGDRGEMHDHVMMEYTHKLFKGRVERLNGVSYTSTTKRKSIIQRSRMEAWYPESMDSPRIMDDFIFLCNKGVYTPIVEEKPEELIDLTKVDPKLIATIKAMMK
jgi:hypothetical protein